MEKRHDIKTISDILAAVNQGNKENFLKDFSAWLDFAMAIDMIVKATGGAVEDPDRHIFKWIDDGKNDITIKIHSTQKV